MRDVLDRLVQWWADGERVAVGTVVRTWSSAPRPPGAAMLVGPAGEAVGVSRAAAWREPSTRLPSGCWLAMPPSLEHYGVSDDDAFAVGLTCGGTIEVFVEAIDPRSFPGLDALAEDIEQRRPVAVATVVSGPGNLGGHLVYDRTRGRGRWGRTVSTTPSPTTSAACSTRE